MGTRNEWDPRSEDALANPLDHFDSMRKKCPVAHSDYLGFSVFRHSDVLAILNDPDTFSSRVSRHVSVPNSMDPPEHTLYRDALDPYFDETSMQRFAPVCEEICDALVSNLQHLKSVDIMRDLAHPFALDMQCAFLGWSENLKAWLLDWVNRKNEASLSGDRDRNAQIAQEFESTVSKILQERRDDPALQTDDDVTWRLMQTTIAGKPIEDKAVISILRNWTVGELQTIAASVGIIVNFLATHPSLQMELRKDPTGLWYANDEILRLHAPLVAAKRTPTKTVTLGNHEIQAGDRLTLSWMAANRDETVFDEPEKYRADRDPALNLLYGAGIHVCPGAPLARLELVTVINSLLHQTTDIKLLPEDPPVLAVYPDAGFKSLPVALTYQ